MKCKDCPYYNSQSECRDACIYDYCPRSRPEDDIGTATVKEMRAQNEYIKR